MITFRRLVPQSAVDNADNEMCIRDRFKEMYRWIDNSVHLNVNDMFDAALRNTRIEMSPAERRQFYEKHIRHMTLTIDENGNVSIELKRG